MKTHIIIYFLGFLLCFAACKEERISVPALENAEALMENNPHMALTLLKGIADSVAAYPEEARMYYQLLTIQAKDKLYITHTNDSLINHIVRYYEDLGDKERLMLAYYYQGRVYRDMNDAPRALKSFQQAEKLNVPNDDLLNKVYSQMGYLFMYQDLYDEAIQINRKAMDCYLRQGKQTKISYMQRDIARMYDMKNMPDSALHYYKEACNTALADGDSTRYYEMLGEVGRFYYNEGQTEKSKHLFLELECNSKIKNKSHIHLTLGYIYQNDKQMDSARFYFQQVLLSGNTYKQYYSYKKLFDIESSVGNDSKASEYARQAFVLKDSIDKVTQTEAIAKINSLYNYQRIEKENVLLKLEKEKQRSQLLLLSLIFGAAIAGYTFFFYVQKNKKQKEVETERQHRQKAEDNYAKSQEELRCNEEKMRALNTQFKEALTEKDQLKAEQIQLQQKLLQVQNEEILLKRKEQELRIATIHCSTLYKEFLEAAKGNLNLMAAQHADKWLELEREIDKTYPGFIDNLHVLRPKLSMIEMRVCMLAKLGFPPSEVAVILNYTRQGITNIRTRVYKKLQDGEGKYVNFAHFIENF